jgi:hypothetical protein
MYKAYSYVKSGLKYTTILLALILFVGIFYNGFYKEMYDKEKLQVEESEVSVTSPQSTDLCQTPNFSNRVWSLSNAVFKCALAFLAGGLLSDMKFLKFGII